MMSSEEISEGQASFYGGLYERHGSGVDAVASTRPEYKAARYDRLCRVFGSDPQFSMHDVGFGVGHLREYVAQTFPDRDVDWSGSEVTPQFVEHVLNDDPLASVYLRDLADKPSNTQYDYVILAGTFYHLAGSNELDFMDHMERLVTNCWHMCRRGLAFNLVTDAVDYRIDDLFYPDIGDMLRVVRQLTRFFEIDHATPLFEYTVRLYSQDWLAEKYPEEAFDRYLNRLG